MRGFLAIIVISLFLLGSTQPVPQKIPDNGSPLPYFKYATHRGDSITPTDLAGKFWLIEFWASWCQPCRIQNQQTNFMLDSMVQKDVHFKEKFGVLGISLDENREVWQKAIRNDFLEWDYHVIDSLKWDGEVANNFGITYLPYNLIVNQRGIIVAQGLHGQALRNKIEDLLVDN